MNANDAWMAKINVSIIFKNLAKIFHSAAWWILVLSSGTITSCSNLMAGIFLTFEIIILKLP